MEAAKDVRGFVVVANYARRQHHCCRLQLPGWRPVHWLRRLRVVRIVTGDRSGGLLSGCYDQLLL
jgi:hypothetical protein